MELSQLGEKVVVIVGASKGIGKATANLLEKQGTKLILGARHIEELEREYRCENVIKIPVDVTDENSVKQFLDKSIHYFNKIDVLINSAGVGAFDSLLDSKTEDFDRMVAVNLRGTYLTCKHFGRQMKKQQDGQILNLVSIAGTTALARNGGYTASKFGVLGLTKVLQAELRREGVRTTSVLPGAVNSSFWDGMNIDLDPSNMIPVEALAEYIAFLMCQPKQTVVDEITIMPPEGIL